MEKRNFLKGASVLLIAAVMILSTFAVTANTDEIKADIAPTIGVPQGRGDFPILFEIDLDLNTQCVGVGYDGDNFWVSAGDADTGYCEFYIYAEDGTLVEGPVHQGGSATGWGHRDMAYDGDYMFGSYDFFMDGFSDPSTYEGLFQGPISPNRAMAYDGTYFYTSGFSEQLWQVEWDGSWGSVGTAVDLGGPHSGAYGLAYDEMSDCLWMTTADYTGNLFQFDMTGGLLNTYSLLPEYDIQGGCTMANTATYGYVLVVLQQFTPDRLTFYDLGYSGPNLDCAGDLDWVDVEPGATVTGSFTVDNIGDAGSELDWEIESFPDWGTWTFDPDGGTGLLPGSVTVDVEVVAPDDPETEFAGEVVLVNSDDPTDTCIIAAALVTPVSQQFIQASVANNFIQSSQVPYQPIGGLGSLYLQTPVGPDGSWTFTTSDVLLGYLVQDNFHDVTATIEDLHWWGLPLIYSSGWTQGNPEDLEFEVIFYEDDAGSPGAVVATYSNLFPTYTFYANYAGLYDAYLWEIDGLDVDLAAGWLSIQSTSSPTSTSLLWANSEDIPPGDGYSLQDGGALEYDEAFELTGGVPTIPDLDCDGTLSWIDVTPGETVAGTFTVENIGDDGSMLDWCIVSYPDWGTFTFDPDGGTGLPIGEVITVDVEVVAPDDPETEFEGEIVLENCDDPTDTCTINVALATPQSQSLILQFLDMIAQRFPILGMILAALF